MIFGFIFKLLRIYIYIYNKNKIILLSKTRAKRLRMLKIFFKDFA